MRYSTFQEEYARFALCCALLCLNSNTFTNIPHIYLIGTIVWMSHCQWSNPTGHEYTPQNWYIITKQNTQQSCVRFMEHTVIWLLHTSYLVRKICIYGKQKSWRHSKKSGRSVGETTTCSRKHVDGLRFRNSNTEDYWRLILAQNNRKPCGRK